MEQGKLLILDRKVNSDRGLRVMRGVIVALLGSAFLLTTAQATTYRWTGDDGQVTYSQLPPGDGRPFKVIGPPPPAASSAASEKAGVDNLRQGQADAAEDKELAADEADKAAEKQAVIDRNCEISRQNRDSLEGSPNRLIRLPDGTVRRMLPEERDAKLKEARDYIEENCL